MLRNIAAYLTLIMLIMIIACSKQDKSEASTTIKRDPWPILYPEPNSDQVCRLDFGLAVGNAKAIKSEMSFEKHKGDWSVSILLGFPTRFGILSSTIAALEREGRPGAAAGLAKMYLNIAFVSLKPGQYDSRQAQSKGVYIEFGNEKLNAGSYRQKGNAIVTIEGNQDNHIWGKLSGNLLTDDDYAVYIRNGKFICNLANMSSEIENDPETTQYSDLDKDSYKVIETIPEALSTYSYATATVELTKSTNLYGLSLPEQTTLTYLFSRRGLPPPLQYIRTKNHIDINGIQCSAEQEIKIRDTGELISCVLAEDLSYKGPINRVTKVDTELTISAGLMVEFILHPGELYAIKSYREKHNHWLSTKTLKPLQDIQ